MNSVKISHYASLRSILIILPLYNNVFHAVLILPVFETKPHTVFLFYLRTTCPAHPIFFNFVTLIIALNIYFVFKNWFMLPDKMRCQISSENWVKITVAMKWVTQSDKHVYYKRVKKAVWKETHINLTTDIFKDSFRLRGKISRLVSCKLSLW